MRSTWPHGFDKKKSQHFQIEFRCVAVENEKNHESAIGDADAVVCDIDGSVEPLIESRDVVDVPQITITSVDSGENSIESKPPSVLEVVSSNGVDNDQNAAKHHDDVAEVIALNETIENIVENQEISISHCENVDVSSSVEIENNKMAASGESNGKSVDSCAIEIAASTTDEGISMDDSTNHGEMSSTVSGTSLNTSGAANTDAMAATAANQTIDTVAAKNSKKPSRRPRNKAKKSTGNGESAAEMATEADVYEILVTPRQRQYQLMVKNVHRKMPADDCEVFVSNIPINVLEEELIPLFDRYGKIWNLRLLMSLQSSRRNAGFAFVRYTSTEAAQDAVTNLSNYEILPGKMLVVRRSQPNLSLFCGNINRNQTKEQIHAIFNRLTKGLTKTVVKSSYYEADKNCGFCFLEYETHAAAVAARLVLKRAKVWGRQLFIDWSQRRTENDDTGSEKNSTLFINNLPKNITDDVITEKLSQFGEIGSVTIIKDYAFVEFVSRESAVAAKNGLNANEAFETDDTEVSFALKRPLRNRNGFARQPRPHMNHSFGFHPRPHMQRMFKKHMSSTTHLSRPAEKSQPDEASTSASAVAEEQVADVHEQKPSSSEPISTEV